MNITAYKDCLLNWIHTVIIHLSTHSRHTPSAMCICSSVSPLCTSSNHQLCRHWDRDPCRRLLVPGRVRGGRGVVAKRRRCDTGISLATRTCAETLQNCEVQVVARREGGRGGWVVGREGPTGPHIAGVHTAARRRRAWRWWREGGKGGTHLTRSRGNTRLWID